MPRRKSLSSYQITQELLERVEQYAARGLTMQQICSCLDWSHDTLCRKKRMHSELAEAIKRGQDKGVATITNALFQNAKNGNLGAQCFYLKNKGGWKDEVVQTQNRRVEVIHRIQQDMPAEKAFELYRATVTDEPDGSITH